MGSRGQHATDLRHGHLAKVRADQQAHHAVDIGQALPVERVDRHYAVQPQLADLLAGLAHRCRVDRQAVDKETVSRPQGGCESAVAAAHVDDQPAFDPRGRQDFRGLGRPTETGRGCMTQTGQGYG